VSPSCHVVSLSPVLLALTQEELARGQVPRRIRGLFDVVYSWLKTAEVRQTGHNYAVYDKGSTQDLLLVRVGFPVSGRFADTERVQCVELGGGDAAHATHVGPYGELHRTYAALTEWCARAAVPLSGQSWEVYGDWHDDPSKLETDIYFRLGAGR
jgi:effector-binding domain-containing protein